MKKTNITISRASSLVVAVLVMGILITLTLGLSNLVIREIRQTSDAVAAARAYYAAEAGVENALLDLSRSLPGYETPKADGASYSWVTGKFSAGSAVAADFRYQIRNQGNAYPYFDPDKPYFMEPDNAVPVNVLYDLHPEYTYNVLPLNKTVTIPLFTDCGNGTVNNVEDFLLQYYVDFDLDPNITLPGHENKKLNAKLQDFDVLRWKLFGEPTRSGDKGKTEAISDFYPAHENDIPSQPVCLGTDSSLASLYDSSCILGLLNPDNRNLPTEASWSIARECYASDAGFGAGHSLSEYTDIMKDCSINTFIGSHTKNYLTLTNIVNPDIIGISNVELRKSRANIYYRIIAKGGVIGSSCGSATPLPREYAEISADGFAGGGLVKQSIDVKMKLNSFLPVFNFSLYRTDTTK